jgi:Ca2+-binding EF-hand superfamily protein
VARSFLSRCFCRLYRVLLCAYPADFRRRYGGEMAQVFGDRCRGIARTQGLRGLLWFGMRTVPDWLTSTVRERIDSTIETGTASQAFDGVPVFYTVASFSPRPGALIHGGVLSLAVFAAISFAIGHSGSHPRLLIGSHHPSRSHLLAAKTTAVPADLAAEVKANPYPDEVPINPYFRLILVLGALDTDRDNIISASEIAGAPAALKKLDKNRDGKLTAEECGLRLPDQLEADPRVVARSRLQFMRVHPVLAALDADHDGVISSSEIKRAPAALWTLDKNVDGRLTIDELLPDPVTSWVAQLISIFDTDGDGKISKEERSNKFGLQFRELLDRADRNKDGVVTEEELTDAVRWESLARRR